MKGFHSTCAIDRVIVISEHAQALSPPNSNLTTQKTHLTNDCFMRCVVVWMLLCVW